MRGNVLRKENQSSIYIVNKLTSIILIPLLVLVFISGCSFNDYKKVSPVKVAIAWSNQQDSYSFQSTLKAVKAAGGEPVVLDMVRSFDLSYDELDHIIGSKDEHGILTSESAKLVKCNTFQNSNVADVIKDYKCVIFPGGSDICPTLYYNEQPWHGIDGDTSYSVERDVSDYLLMSYCLENDIPTFCICRGMQLLSIVSGDDMIQDIGQYMDSQGITYSNIHRDPNKKVFISHDVNVLSHDSILYSIAKEDVISKVPSWHHQIVKDVNGTRLVVTAISYADGIPIIEGVERIDKDYFIGVQFHPEVAVAKVVDNEEDAGNFMNYEADLAYFTKLIEKAEIVGKRVVK